MRSRQMLSVALSLVLFMLFLSGCANDLIRYQSPNGNQVDTTPIGLQTMAIRDQNIAVEDSYNEAMKDATDIQAVALMANKLTAKAQPIEREPTASEEGRAWASLLLRYFGGGGDVLNRKNVNARSEVYNINGNNNNMAGIKTQATSQSGDVSQTVTSDSKPVETKQTWLQQETTGSANGESNPVSNDTITDFGATGANNQ